MLSIFNMSQTINHWRTHQSQYVKRNKISGISNLVGFDKNQGSWNSITCTEQSKKISKDCLMQKHRVVTRKIIFTVPPVIPGPKSEGHNVSPKPPRLRCPWTRSTHTHANLSCLDESGLASCPSIFSFNNWLHVISFLIQQYQSADGNRSHNTQLQ